MTFLHLSFIYQRCYTGLSFYWILWECAAYSIPSVMATRYNGGGIPAAAGSEEQLQKSPILIHERITTPTSAYVGLNDSRQLPGTYVKTQYGYSQESLPT